MLIFTNPMGNDQVAPQAAELSSTALAGEGETNGGQWCEPAKPTTRRNAKKRSGFQPLTKFLISTLAVMIFTSISGGRLTRSERSNMPPVIPWGAAP